MHTTKCNYTWCSTGIVYLVTSNRCHKQYVGQILGSLHTRLIKADVKHNIPCESTYHFRNKQHTTGDVQIEDIDHTDIQTDKRKCRKRPTDQRNTLDQHTIHYNTPRSQLHLNRHHNLNQMKKPTKIHPQKRLTIQYNTIQYNTIQHNTTHT